MKKVFLTLALAAFAFAANAQFVIGGNLGFRTSNVKNAYDGKTIADKNTVNKFGFDLRGGYQINDKMQVGLMLGYDLNTTKAQTPDPLDVEKEAGYGKTNSHMFNVTPYFRYNCFEFGSRFTFFAEARVNLGFGGGYAETSLGSTTTKVDMPKEFVLGIGVLPGVNYKVSDNVSFDLYLDFIGLGYNMHKYTQNDATTGNKDKVRTDSDFGFDFHTSGMSILDLATNITVGFNYHF